MLRLLSAIRPLNLILVASSQWILYYVLIKQLESEVYNFQSSLHTFQFAIITAITILVTAAGYLINDYFDYESDRSSRSAKQFVNKILYLKYYYIAVVMSLILCGILAIQMSQLQWLLYVLLAHTGLFLYSAFFKSSILIGNIIVASFTAASILLIPIADIKALRYLKELNYATYEEVQLGFIFIAALAFLLNLLREFVKDLEDKFEDSSSGIITAANRWSLKAIKRYMFAIWTMLLVVEIIWLSFIKLPHGIECVMNVLILLIAPLFWIFVLIFESKNKNEFTRLSRICKLAMFAGLIHLILI